MSFSDRILVAQTVILFLTGAVVTWYTWETARIRRATIRQSETAVEQARLAAEQLHLFRDQLESARVERVSGANRARGDLASRIAALISRLQPFAISPNARQRADAVFRTSPVWTDEQISAMQDSARLLGNEYLEVVQQLHPHLQYLADRIAEVRLTTRMMGYQWERFDWDTWDTRFKVSLELAVAAYKNLTEPNPEPPASSDPAM